MNDDDSESKVSEIVDEVFAQSKYRFLLLIIMSIAISGGLVAVSMAMYNVSGAAQLDLSRPGYNDVRDQVDKTDNTVILFPETGSISQSAINGFGKELTSESQKIQAVDAFGGDPLSPEALGLSAE